MWTVIAVMARTYAPYVMWPVAAVVGVIGYNFERMVRGDKQTPYRQSVSDEREERLLQETVDKDPTDVDLVKDRKFVPKTIFDRKTS